MQKDKFTPIHNDVLEALAKINLSPYETRILFVVWRKTFGFTDENGNRKKLDYIALRQFTELTGLDRRLVSRALTSLKKKKIIIKEGMKLGFTKKFISVISNDDKKVSSTKTTKSSVEMNGVIGRDDKLSSVETHTKEKKETNTKENVIFKFWNDKNIIPCRKMNGSIIKELNSLLRDGYSLKDIKQSIHCYALILEDDDYFFKYKWTLKEFLQKGFEKFLDPDVAHENYLRKK